jgi:hypothetical protein
MKYILLLGFVIISIGMVGFGYFSIDKLRADRGLIEVRGLSERVVRSDVADASIIIVNRNYDLEKLYEKRLADKTRVLGFLKENGFLESEITGFTMDTNECNEEDSVTADGVTTKKKRRYFSSEDVVNVRTKSLEKVERIKSDLLKLLSENIFVKCNYSYKLTSFQDIKLEMMKEASENAMKSAMAFVVPFEKKIGEVVYLHQGEIAINGEDEREGIDSWYSKESTSKNKKLRLVVKAGFSKACDCFPCCACR